MFSSIKVMTIFVTRPEAIKMAFLVLELHKHPEHFESIVTVTSQHHEMRDQVLNIFKITPDFDLNIMKDLQTLVDVTTRGLEAGTLKLAGIEEKSIYELATEFLTNRAAYENMAKAVNPYGDGNASRRICEAIRYYFQQTNDRPVEYKPQI